VDAGAGGRKGQLPDGDDDPSINGCTDDSDMDLFPSIQYFSIAQLSAMAGVMMAAGVPLAQGANDYCAWYEQLSRRWNEQPSSAHWLVSEGCAIEFTSVFGFKSECHVSQRISFFVRWCCNRAIWRRQQEMEALPASVPEEVTRWSSDRRSIGASGRWWESGSFFDDTITVHFEFFSKAVLEAQVETWAALNIAVADGHVSQHTGESVKDKRQAAKAGEEMISLGLYIDLIPPGQRTLGKQKRVSYIEEGSKLLAAVDASHKQSASKDGLEKYTGRIGFASSVDPLLKSELQVFRAALGLHWVSTNNFRFSTRMRETVHTISARLDSITGVALLPTSAPFDNSTVPLIFVFSDAARAPDAPREEFRGYGYWIWPLHSETIYWSAGRWTNHEQKSLDSTCLELQAQLLAIHALPDVLSLHYPHVPPPPPQEGAISTQRWCDIICVCDNDAAVAITNSGRATGPTQRAMCKPRAELLRRLQVRSLSVHAVRETLGLTAADDLSKGKPDEAMAVINNLFDKQMQFKELTAPTSVERSLDHALAATKFPVHGPKKRKRRRKNGTASSDQTTPSGQVPNVIDTEKIDDSVHTYPG